jgi:PEGA domain
MTRSSLRFRLLACAAVCLVAAEASAGKSDALGEVRLEPAGKAERDAGVWIDGRYVGYVRELDRRRGLTLVPGPHELVVKLAGFRDIEDTIVVAPGQRVDFSVAMSRAEGVSYPDLARTAVLKLSVAPERAAVFIDGAYVGNVDRFDTRRGVRLAAGTYELRVALPGYATFETELKLRADQVYELSTELKPASLGDPSDEPLLGRSED